MKTWTQALNNGVEKTYGVYREREDQALMKQEEWIAFDYHTKKQSKRVPYTFQSEQEAKDFITQSAKDLKVFNRLVYPLLKSKLQ